MKFKAPQILAFLFGLFALPQIVAGCSGDAKAFSMFGPGMPMSPAIRQAQQQAANSGACYSIQDSDARTYCLARAHRESGRCYSIKSADTRSQCLAEVRK